MPRTSNTLPPEIASKLADVASELREHIYGEQACPKWGTRFTEIEDQGMQVGLELARVFMQQSVQHQADGDIPPQAIVCDGEQSVIQLLADNLCETDPLSDFWKERAKNRTGLRRSVGIRKAAALPSATSRTLSRTHQADLPRMKRSEFGPVAL